MKIILISPFLPSFYEDSPNATNHFPLCLLPLQCAATPQPQSLNDSIKIDKTKHKSASCTIWVSQHAITSINLEYQSALLCTLALKVFVMSTVPGMQAIQTPCMFDCHQKSFLSFLSSLVYANMATNMVQMSQEINLILLHPLLHS